MTGIAAVAALFGETRTETPAPDSVCCAYKRGDPSVTRVALRPRVPWNDVPMVLGFGFLEVGDRTLVFIRLDVLRHVRMSRAAIAHFEGAAKAEFDSITTTLAAAARRSQEARAESKGEPPTDGSSAVSPDDFCVLGLRRGAKWSEVQVAYRELCKQFHPDRLVGQNLPPHVADLAAQRFKEATAAYHRLRGRFAATSAA